MKIFAVEQRTIDVVPEDERFGRAKDLLGIWFAFNMGPLGLVTGAAAVALNLPTVWAIVGLVIGNLLGGLTMAFHAAQGPTLGVPQMLQARGQFGLRGATVLTVVQTMVATGFFVSVAITVAQSLNQLYPAISVHVAIIGSVGVSFVITFVGFRLISAIAKLTAWVVGLVSLALIVLMFWNGSITGATLQAGRFTAQNFLLAISVAASWQLAWAPNVSDYSRYLPSRTGSRPAFWYTYLGCSLGAAFMMALGALAASTVFSGDALEGLHNGVGALGPVVLVLCIVAATAMNTVNTYSATICMVSTYEGFRAGRRLPGYSRFIALVLTYLIAIALALAGSSDFTTYFITFIYAAMYVLVPWSAINLADYYVVKHGQYDVAQFFLPHAGSYGNWNAHAAVAFIVGLALEVPFMSTQLYTGPIAHQIGGIDVAWVVGFLASFGLYVAIARKSRGIDENDAYVSGTQLAVE